jgi:BirA family transcriptional regulator, biotin operon repressor / biotin---[acetyl-CoA-carboxylase] ligase
VANELQSELRKKLLDAFSDKEGQFISGQRLAETLRCSRTAVWKHIEDLRREGFEVEAIRNKGYRLRKTTESVNADEIRLGLKTSFIGQSIFYEDIVDSTQIIAHRLSNEGANEGTIVIAEEQTLGRGRMDRKWYSPKYTGVWMSIILRPKIPLQEAPQLTLLTAVAVVLAIEELTDLSPQIKWPNDILLNGKKVTGILTELQAEADQINSVIIGIGINVNQKQEDFLPELRSIATSIAIEHGNMLNRAALIRSVLVHLEKLYLLFLEKGFYPIKLLWESHAISIGKVLRAKTLTAVIEGKALGITDQGVLQIEDQAGKVHLIYSADIELGK